MKSIKRVIAASLTAAMMLSLAGCSKIEFEQIKAKDFAKALKGVDIEELTWDDYWWDAGTYYYGTGDDIPSSFSSNYDGDVVAVVDGEGNEGASYLFLEYEDEDDAHDYFEDIYDSYKEFKEDGDISGTYRTSLTNNSGYILINGEVDGDDAYVAIYYTGSMFVQIYDFDADDDSIDEIKEVLETIGFSAL